MKRIRAQRAVIGIVSSFFLLTPVSAVSAGPIQPSAAVDFEESFKGSQLTQPQNWSVSYAEVATWIMQNSADSPPCLTARSSSEGAQTLKSGTISSCVGLEAPDEVGFGALRLIRDLAETDKTQAASMVYTLPQPSDRGMDISFKMALWDQTLAADGLAFFLKDGADANDAPGGAGGALGYAADESRDGVSGGLLGIAFDKYGNFANPASSCSGETGSRQSDSITIRGAGSGRSGYCRIASVQDPSFFTGATRLEAARQVRIIVDPDTSADPKVSIYFGPVGALPMEPTVQVDMPDELLSATTFKFGFGAASGWYKINAAVWDLSIEPSPDSEDPEPDTDIEVPEPDIEDPSFGFSDVVDNYQLPELPNTGVSNSSVVRNAGILLLVGGLVLMIRTLGFTQLGMRSRGPRGGGRQ